jgi:hypothetical protein
MTAIERHPNRSLMRKSLSSPNTDVVLYPTCAAAGNFFGIESGPSTAFVQRCLIEDAHPSGRRSRYIGAIAYGLRL